MKDSNFVKQLSLLIFLHAGFALHAQTILKPDLAKLFKSGSIKTFNRTTSLTESGKRKNVIHLDEKPDAGIAWLDGIAFSEGTIEFDLKGRNVMQKSFVGIAFHGNDDKRYDAIYFRPFNFKSTETERKNHSVQYISLPENDWPKLRKEHPNQYEKPVNPVPEPDEWFHVKIVIEKKEVKVFVEQSEEPSLVVRQLSNQGNGKIGFWVGDQASGDFADLKINKK
ncbi:hypothetical protein L0657_02895 [Dyadobacter sp. CY345]|uniref:hypothetical protein n=1 Tax=Dyadobacter sp. CY345 TaxID=2909335 RepID=UPI001F352DDE|nr:hypothetical protein [Dyadobacter sp. CY345]MCF2442890.1 hypothetical protein [Dyadobacter sp. CY345]